MTTTVEPAEPTRAKRPTFSLRSLMVAMLMASVLLAGLWYMGREVTKARQASLTSATQGPLNQVLMALHNYHAQHGSLPPAFIADKNGKPMHSWRVLILPYLDDNNGVYQAYRFDEPWNSPHNLSLADSMPRSFLARTEPASRRNTNIVVIVGPDTAFPGANATKFDDFKDGMGNTILVTEIADSDICWLEPRDLDAATMSFQVNDRKKPSISSVSWRQPYVVFADSIHAYPVPEDASPKALRAFSTIAGGEAITRDQVWLPDP